MKTCGNTWEDLVLFGMRDEFWRWPLLVLAFIIVAFVAGIIALLVVRGYKVQRGGKLWFSLSGIVEQSRLKSSHEIDVESARVTPEEARERKKFWQKEIDLCRAKKWKMRILFLTQEYNDEYIKMWCDIVERTIIDNTVSVYLAFLPKEKRSHSMQRLYVKCREAEKRGIVHKYGHEPTDDQIKSASVKFFVSDWRRTWNEDLALGAGM